MTDDLNITIFRTLSITLLLCITGPKITLLPVLALIIAQVGTFNIYRNNHIYKLYVYLHISFCILQHRKITWPLYFDKSVCYLCIDRCIASINSKKIYMTILLFQFFFLLFHNADWCLCILYLLCSNQRPYVINIGRIVSFQHRSRQIVGEKWASDKNCEPGSYLHIRVLRLEGTS